MYEHGNVCPICGVGTLEKNVIEEVFTYKEKTLTVPNYEVYECAECGEGLVDPASSSRASKLLKEFGKEVDGLLTTADIKRIRKKLGLTQEEMAEVCGGGLKGFARYESGQVIQSKGMDNFLRIIDEFPFTIDVITNRHSKKGSKVVNFMEYKSKRTYSYAEQQDVVAYSDNLKSALG